MAALRIAYIKELEDYFTSGTFSEDFMNSPEDRRHEMLEFAEALMDAAEKADEAVTKIIFRKVE